MRQGYVQIYTGNGKGKTTAALGLAVRALGAGLKVFLLQFCKGRPSSELSILEKLPRLTIERFGRTTLIREVPGLEECRLAQDGLKSLRAALGGGRYDVVIADEICTACSLGLFQEQEILECIRARPKRVELVLTGRGATPGLKRAADLVTDMRAVRHYFSRGVRARKGIEF